MIAQSVIIVTEQSISAGFVRKDCLTK